MNHVYLLSARREVKGNQVQSLNGPATVDGERKQSHCGRNSVRRHWNNNP